MFTNARYGILSLFVFIIAASGCGGDGSSGTGVIPLAGDWKSGETVYYPPDDVIALSFTVSDDRKMITSISAGVPSKSGTCYLMGPYSSPIAINDGTFHLYNKSSSNPWAFTIRGTFTSEFECSGRTTFFNIQTGEIYGKLYWTAGNQNATMNSFTSFSIISPVTAVGTINDTEITIQVPPDTPLNSMIATFTTDEGATVTVLEMPQESGVTVNDFTNPVYYTVTAINGTPKNYTVRVEHEPAFITSFEFASINSVSTINDTTIDVTVPYRTDLTNLIATFSTSVPVRRVLVGMQEQTSGTTTNDFTQQVTYTVEALDGVTTDYLVNVTPDVASLAKSSFNVGQWPVQVLVNPAANFLYVRSQGDNCIYLLNATTGEFVWRSDLDGFHDDMKLNIAANRIYVINSDSSDTNIDCIDATTGEGIDSISMGDEISQILVNESASRLYAVHDSADAITFLDATTGAYINGSYFNSTFYYGSSYSAIAVNPSANILYVVNGNTDSVTFYNATTGTYKNGSLVNSTFTTGFNPRYLEVNQTENILYVANWGDETVTYLDATTGAYNNGTLENSSFSIGPVIELKLHPTANVLYVWSNNDIGPDYLIHLNATTGAYINGSRADATFGDWGLLNPSANILYSISFNNTIIYENATTGAYINGTIENSSFQMGDVDRFQFDYAVNPSANILYVLNYNSGTVTFFNATTGEYCY